MQFRGLIEIKLGEIDVMEVDGLGARTWTDVAASGYYDFEGLLPAGFLPVAGKIQTMEAFVGQTTVGLELGITADPNAFVSTKNGVAKGTINAILGGDMDVAIDADTVVRLTATGNADFTSLTAGKVACSLWCIDMNEPETVVTN